MNEVKTEYSQLEDEYLDCLIKLAYDFDDLEKEQLITEEAEESTSKPDELLVRRTWQKIQEKMDRLDQEEKRNKRRETIRRTVPQVLKVAACLLLIISLSVPVVLATSSEFRSRIINLLYSIDHENQVVHFEFAEDQDASFAVPAGWNGDYFMSYIPETMEKTWQSELFATVNYADTTGRGFGFSEKDENVSMSTGLEDQVYSIVDINGSMGYLLDGTTPNNLTHTVTIVWPREDKWFELSCNDMDTEEALKIARSVRKIIR